MATTQEAIARLRMIFETQGADAAVAEMKKLETAETNLGTSSLNLDRAFGNLERRYSETARATAEYERAMKTLNAAVAQNPALAERAAAVQQTVVARYQATMQAAQQAAASHTALGQVNQALQGQMQALAGSTGLFGSALSVMSRGGLAVATGIGAAVLAFNSLNDAANNMAKYATDTKRFAEATGLTTAQVQGLNKEASKFGISGETVERFVTRFTSGFEEMRSGAGGLFESIRKVDAGLAEQMRSSEDETAALQKLIEAIKTADTVWQKAALARAAGAGKGAAAMVPFLSQLDVGGLTAGRRGLSQELIDDLDKGRIAVEEASREMAVAWSKNWAKAFLDTKRQWYETGRDLLNMPAAISAQATQSTTRAGDVEALKVFEEQEQILKKRLEEIEAAAAAMGDESSRQFIKLTQDAGRLREQLEEVRKEKAKIAQPDAGAPTAAATPAAAEGPAAVPTLGQMKTDDIVAASNRYKELRSVLGSLVPVAQQVEEALRQIELAIRSATTEEYKAQILAAKDALIALTTVQAEMGQVAPGTYERQLEALNEIKAEYPDLVAQDAVRMKYLDDQLRIAQAMPGVARMEAEEQARITQLKGAGMTLELATTIAAKERAVVQAQINTAAQQQLFNLRNQAQVAAAVTGADRIRAQEQATIAALIQQGVDAETAGVIAAQERANAEAAVNAQVEQQVTSLNESTELIRAQIRDMQEQAGSAHKILGFNEMNVRAQQAFNRAIREGADYAEAAALRAATYNNLLAQRAMQIEQQKQSARRADLQFAAAYSYEEDRGSGSQLAQSQQALGEQIKSLAQAGSQTAQTLLTQLEGAYGASWLFNADRLLGPLRKAQQEVADLPQQQRAEQALDQLKQLQDEFRLGGAATPEAKAQIQWQLTYEKLIKEGVSASVAQQIANQELANTMQELAKSVDANTTALQSQLDPIYTEGRAALRIGYYGEGAGGTQRVVTGTGYANENVPAAGNAQASNLIVINNNFASGAVMGDRRTQYQAANAYGRAIAATGK